MRLPLETGERGLADLQAFFDSVAGMFASQKEATGCLMVNSMVEFGGADAVVARHHAKHLARLRGAIGAALERAVVLGEIQPDGVITKRDLVLSLVLGVTVAARAGLGHEVIDAMIESIRKQIREWASPSVDGGGERHLASF